MNKKFLFTLAIIFTLLPIQIFAQSPTDSVRTQLDQIDNIQSKVTNAIPENFQEKISMWLLAVNTWREKISWYYIDRESEIDHQMNVEALAGTQFDTNDAGDVKEELKKGGIMDVLVNIWQYAQLAFFSFMAFVFANKYIFYVFAIVMGLIFLRVIYKIIFH